MFATASNNPARIVQKRQIGFRSPVASTLLRTSPRGSTQSPTSTGTVELTVQCCRPLTGVLKTSCDWLI